VIITGRFAAGASNTDQDDKDEADQYKCDATGATVERTGGAIPRFLDPTE